MVCTLDAVCWMWILTSAMALPVARLNLYLGDIDQACWPEGRAYNTSETISTTISYASAQTNGQLASKEGNYNLNFVASCSLVEAAHISSVISFPRKARLPANSSAGHSVFLGPRLGSNCHFITDWIALAADSSEAHRNLYEISYLCQNVKSFRHSQKFLSSHSEKIAFAVNLKDPTLIRSLNIFLRRKGWKNIVVFFESSPAVLTLSALAQDLEMYLSTTATGEEPLNVLTVHYLQLNSDPRVIVERFCNPCEAIILLVRPSISSYFFDMVSNMSFCENSETAIIQVDPSNVITYDVLRLWRYILSDNGTLGAAAQCTFMMSALPAGQGFNISSFILESKIHVSLASAVASAIRLTYVNYAENDDVLPTNTNFFAPLSRGSFTVPVLPNVTYSFSHSVGEAIEYYDFYVFTFKPAIFGGTTNMSALGFEEILELNSVLLSGRRTFTIVNTKIWPNPSRYPGRDFGLLSPCFRVYVRMMGVLMKRDVRRIRCSEAGTDGAVLQPMLVAEVDWGHLHWWLVVYLRVAKRRQQKKAPKIRKCPDRLILYPDDVEAIEVSMPLMEELREDQPIASYGLNVESAIIESQSDGTSVCPGGNAVSRTVLLFNGSILHLKQIDVSEVTLKSKVMDHLRALRELQYENINPFIGVYLDSTSFYLVYEHCSRGSLQDVLAHPTLALDEEFRLFLLNDLIKVFILNIGALIKIAKPSNLSYIMYS
ncbi:unnamed protein product [Dibothriocephalus latus]|uniref:Guanylate cyclase n=1 Tax=Dibothriocephalus latus TaxID=60516 RepID=A0A3P6UQT2_DIBLA|nr:unnamed protein product [Dibothriocephalus latus]